MRAWVRVIVTWITLMFTSCSFVFLETAPNRVPEGRYISCDEGYGYPIADTALTVLSLATIFERTQRDDEFSSDEGETSGIIGGLVMVGVFAASAYYGFTQTARCGDIHKRYAATYGESGYAPPPVYDVLGTEGRACRQGGQCNPGLVCASNICVLPPRMAPPAPVPAPLPEVTP